MNGEHARTRAVVIASGARYRRPDVANLAAFEGTSVHYWASPLEAMLCAGQVVTLVGAGNPAGQAVIYRCRDIRCAGEGVAALRLGRDRRHLGGECPSDVLM